jgi:hypothetical protein
MTTLTSHIVTGSIVPGEIDPRLRRSYFTSTPYGDPIREEKAIMPSVAVAALKPKPLGDEHMMKVLQNVLQKQGTTEASLKESIPANRTWRN